MGIDGNCTHAVLESEEETRAPLEDNSRQVIEKRQPLGACDEALFVVQGDDPPELVQALEDLQSWLDRKGTNAEVPIESLAREWYSVKGAPGRKKTAAAFVARDAAQLMELIAEAQAQMREDPSRPLPRSMDRDGRE